MRFGLCCLFKEEKINFRTTTARVLSGMPRGEQLVKLSGICHDNARNLQLALEAVHRLGIGAFRIMSPLFPRSSASARLLQRNTISASAFIRTSLSCCHRRIRRSLPTPYGNSSISHI